MKLICLALTTYDLYHHDQVDFIKELIGSLTKVISTCNGYHCDINESDGSLFAREKKGSLIAIATHGRKGLSHSLNKSIAEKIGNHFNYPIWTCLSKK